MENNINNIDKFFKDRLDGHQSPPIPGAWDNMAAMLDADDKGAAIAGKNINRFILASIAGAIVLAGSVVAYISGYENTPTYANNSTTITNEQIVENAPTTTITKEEETTTTADKANTATIIDIPTTSAPLATKKADATPIVKQNTTSVTPKTPSKTTDNSTTTPPKETKDLTVDKGNTKDIIDIKDSPKPVKEKTITPFNKSTYNSILLSAITPVITNKFSGVYDIDATISAQKVVIDSLQRAQRDLDKMQRFYRTQFGIQAGGNFNRVLNTSSNSFEMGSGVMAGIFFAHNFNRTWGIGAEFNYFRSTGNNINRSINQTEFFLEKTSTNFFVVTKTLEYFQLPVTVNYSLNKKHTFSAGASATLLFNSKTDVITNNQNTFNESSTSSTESGVYEDLNPFNYGVLLGYEYQLPGRYSLGLRYNQMLTDLTNNSFFNDNKKHLPANLQFFVRLNLTR